MENIESLKVVELKALLKDQGLKISGLKQELIERLREHEKRIVRKNVKQKAAALTEEKNTKKEILKGAPKQAITAVYPAKKILPEISAFDDELLDFFGDAETITNIKTQIFDTPVSNDCKHENCFEADGLNICKECGCEVDKLDFQPEWRYYGASDNRSSKDPSRCHRSKESTRGGIDKVFQDAKLGYLPQAIRKKAEQKYKAIVGNETVRGKKRKSIVAACLLYTFRDEGDIRTSDEIRKMFIGAGRLRECLTKQEMSDGLRRYLHVFKEDRNQYVRPSDLIKRTMHLCKINFSHYKYILRIAKTLEGVDSVLNRSSPQSVASAIVYLYLCLTPELKLALNLTKTRFAKEVDLSDITITKLVKKSGEILGLQVDM